MVEKLHAQAWSSSVERVRYTFEPFAQNVCAMSLFVPRTECNHTLYPSARKRDCFPYYEAAFISAFTIIPFSLLNNPFFLFPTYFPYALSFSVQEDTIKGVFAFICSSLAMISEKERFGNEMDPKLLPSNCNSAIYRLFDLTVTYSSGVKTSI